MTSAQKLAVRLPRRPLEPLSGAATSAGSACGTWFSSCSSENCSRNFIRDMPTSSGPFCSCQVTMSPLSEAWMSMPPTESAFKGSYLTLESKLASPPCEVARTRRRAAWSLNLSRATLLPQVVPSTSSITERAMPVRPLCIVRRVFCSMLCTASSKLVLQAAAAFSGTQSAVIEVEATQCLALVPAPASAADRSILCTAKGSSSPASASWKRPGRPRTTVQGCRRRRSAGSHISEILSQCPEEMRAPRVPPCASAASPGHCRP
mmetsp:Transcript_106304/g.328240  ORF Transcript_106304/g.328240 Transcript_106304/m.328240 type:complete len:263 (-) Transcript_106304:1-789(-)